MKTETPKCLIEQMPSSGATALDAYRLYSDPTDNSNGPTRTPTGRAPSDVPIRFQELSRILRPRSQTTPCIVTVDLAEIERRVLAQISEKLDLSHLLKT